MIPLSPALAQHVYQCAHLLRVRIKNPNHLFQALVHRSYAHEMGEPDWQNERLEFLGDSVLGIAAALLLYRRFPAATEGDLTQYKSDLVNTKTLAAMTQELGLQEFILVGKGERRRKGGLPTSILACTYEAVLGAIFLDLGYREVLQLIQRHFEPRLRKVKVTGQLNPKGELQQRLHEQFHSTPTYRVIRTEGPPHRRIFHVGVHEGGRLLGTGHGPSKQEAEQQAAEEALETLSKPPRKISPQRKEAPLPTLKELPEAGGGLPKAPRERGRSRRRPHRTVTQSPVLTAPPPPPVQESPPTIPPEAPRARRRRRRAGRPTAGVPAQPLLKEEAALPMPVDAPPPPRLHRGSRVRRRRRRRRAAKPNA